MNKRKKDEIYDFGELGEWSEETLKRNISERWDSGYNEFCYYVPQIELLYEKRSKELISYYRSIHSIKLKKMTIGDFFYKLRKLLKEDTILSKLIKNHGEYLKVVDGLVQKITRNNKI